MKAPKIFSRKQWGAKHRDGFGSRPIPARECILHHTVTKKPKGGVKASWKADVAAMRTLENIGQSRFGGGISYTYVIMPSGRIFQGHSANRIGAHTQGHNKTGIGIALVGNYSKEQPSLKQLTSLILLFLWLKSVKKLRKDAVMKPHKAFKATSCPGAAAAALIDEINLFHGAVEYGDRGQVVKRIQQRLIAHGVVTFKNARGIFGSGTKAGVSAFRKKLKWKENGGVVTAATYAALIRKA